MNKPVSAKCYSRILNDSEQISPKMRRSRKLSCKKGGVDCEVSRRERDIPNTFGDASPPPLNTSQRAHAREPDSDTCPMAGSSVDVHGLADHDVWDLPLRQYHLATIFS